ncbi:ABC transporter ATP-binding protein [Miniphocaeibacter massiliensis]|uniref:ABC transporter ATP-binding protein n=1 Tax=Miniphocaeibacter massiliensis TaxID=2041841 RepID=UPI001F5D4202|nr:ABC transporter ATP-binding protein [Miniphocaeibacter massiliensis]
MIEIKNLFKQYKEVLALNNFNLTVEYGEIYGLVGPNGSGKTTSINCMLSLLKYDKGEVYLFGKKMSDSRSDLKAKIGYIPQDISVIYDLNVYDNIDFFCGLYISDKATRKKYVEEAIEFAGLNEFRKFLPAKLSGGLRRRLNIACGIAHKPELIIFDEPTVAVDPQSRNKILEGIKELNRNGATIIYTSHYMEEVEYLSTKISIIDKGQILVSGTTKELKNFVGLGNSLEVNNIDLSNGLENSLRAINGVNKLLKTSNNLKIIVDNDMVISNIINHLNQNNIIYDSLNIKTPTLNDVFLDITGRELRDNA